MDPLRITNVSYLNSVPYKPLGELPGAVYTECDPAECARRLIERETDLALIPVAEWFRSGGFYALPFGIVAEGAVDSVVVLSDVPFKDLEEIALDTASHSSAVLLRILLLEFFPELQCRLFRAPTAALPGLISGRRGALIIGDPALKLREKHRFVTDLAAVWRNNTRTPFVFAVWAGSSVSKNLPAIEECLWRCVEERTEAANRWAKEKGFDPDVATRYVTERISYPITQSAAKGLRTYLKLGIKHGLLPQGQLQRQEVNGVQCLGFPQRKVRDLLREVFGRARLSIADTTYLAKRASLAELTLVGRYLEEDTPSYAERPYQIAITNICEVRYHTSPLFRPPGDPTGHILSHAAIESVVQKLGLKRVSLRGGITPELDLAWYEALLQQLRPLGLEEVRALSAEEVFLLSAQARISVQEALERLKKAGLTTLGYGAFTLLLDKYRERHHSLAPGSLPSAQQWAEIYRNAHNVGLRSVAGLVFGFGESWRERVCHLAKIRLLQDEWGGMGSFVCESVTEQKMNPEELLRVQAIAQIFLYNLDCFEFIRPAPHTTPVELGELASLY